MALPIEVPAQVWGFAFALAMSFPVLWWAVSSGDNRVEVIRANLHGSERVRATDVREVELSQSARDRIVEPGLKFFGRLGRRFTPAAHVESLERRIGLAGMTSRWPVERMLATKLALASGGFVLGLFGLAGNSSAIGVLAFLALPVGGYLAPDLVLSRRASDRQDAILRKLPDGLDEITISVEAGLGFEAAMAEAASSSSGPLAEEFARTLQDIQIGASRSEALTNLLRRTDVADLRHFILAVRQAEQYGVPIAKVLRVQSREMRDRRKQRAEERAMKMPVKILIPTIFFILPALFIVILGPAVLRLVDTLGG